MQFTINTSIKGTQESVNTSIGEIKVGSTVVISTPNGNKNATVVEIGSNWIKTSFQFLKFDSNHLGWRDMGAYATIKIVEVLN